MDNYQAKFRNLLSRLDQEQVAATRPFHELAASYTNLMGKADSSITDRISSVNESYLNRTYRLLKLGEEFNTLMEMSDSQLRIANSNMRVDFGNEETNSRGRMKKRKLSESEYATSLFPVPPGEFDIGVFSNLVGQGFWVGRDPRPPTGGFRQYPIASRESKHDIAYLDYTPGEEKLHLRPAHPITPTDPLYHTLKVLFQSSLPNYEIDEQGAARWKEFKLPTEGHLFLKPKVI